MNDFDALVEGLRAYDAGGRMAGALRRRLFDTSNETLLAKSVAELGDMAKAIEPQLAAVRREKRISREAALVAARTKFADINRRATALAMSGGISAYQGALLDNALAAAGRRIGL